MVYIIPTVPIIKMETKVKHKLWQEATEFRSPWYLFGMEWSVKYQKMSWSDEETKTKHVSNSAINMDKLESFTCENLPAYTIWRVDYDEMLVSSEELIGVIVFIFDDQSKTSWLFKTLEERNEEWRRIIEKME